MQAEDKRRLEAADGWLGLGNWQEANAELECISPKARVHPDVLFLRWHIYANAQNWMLAAEVARALSELKPDNPFGFIHHAYALHAMKRTKEAWDTLLPVADRFPENQTLPYNLACYACQLGDLKAAWDWLSKAIDLGGKPNLRRQALDDPDLEPLWTRIAEI